MQLVMIKGLAIDQPLNHYQLSHFLDSEICGLA
jgi:hypothetical protein